MAAQKKIALIAYDHPKNEMVTWCDGNKNVLKRHFLCGTGTTSKLISEEISLSVKALKGGPLGGDQQIGSRIAEGEMDMVIFFSDSLEVRLHDPDIKALLQIANVYDSLLQTTEQRQTFW